MKVEIFIPTFNRARKLKHAVQSVASQSYADIGIVVLDNHSSDETPDMVAAMMITDPRIRYVRHAENIGMIANFNCVGRMAQADFFAVLTDDDEYEPCFVATALDCFAENPAAGFVACNAPTRVGGKIVKNQLDHWREGLYRANTQNLKCVLGHYPLITNCLFRVALKPEFVFHPELGSISDGLLLTCLFAKYDCYVTKTVTGYWNNDGENTSSIQKFEPIRHINLSVDELRLYREFCVRNAVAMRALFLLRLKLMLIALVAADRSSFQHICEHSRMRDALGAGSVRLLRLLSLTRVIRLVLLTLAGLRRINIAFVAWRERAAMRRAS
jgi:glycosyltransferase involved in cell wall biosynthesis